jgi:hypothetical protein
MFWGLIVITTRNVSVLISGFPRTSIWYSQIWTCFGEGVGLAPIFAAWAGAEKGTVEFRLAVIFGGLAGVAATTASGHEQKLKLSRNPLRRRIAFEKYLKI